MKILMDYRTVSGHSWNRGIGEYARNITQAVLNRGHEIIGLSYIDIDYVFEHDKFKSTDQIVDCDVAHILDPMTIRVGFDSPMTLLMQAKVLTSTWFDAIPIEMKYINAWPIDVQTAYWKRIEQLELCNEIFPISQESSRQFPIRGVENKTVAPIGIAHIHKPKHEEYLSPDEGTSVNAVMTRPYIMTVGGCEPHKNVNIISEAFLAAKMMLPDLLWVVVGDESEYREKMKANKLPGQVFLGHITRESLNELYNGQNLVALAFPSIIEGVGLPAYEAALSGANVLCCDKCGALEDLPIKKLEMIPGAFVGAINEIVNGSNEYRCTPEQAQQLHEKYNWDNCARIMEETWQNLVK